MKGTALITGGAKRIGKAMAMHLASQGFSIALHCNKSIKKAELTASEIKRLGVECDIFPYDLIKEQNALLLIKDVKSKFPDLNLLLNSASIFEKSSLVNTTIDLFDKIFNINFKAPFFLSQAFAKDCCSGNIINIVDTRISKNKTKYLAYTLSKKLLADFTKMSALELAPNIRVNAIAPGIVIPANSWEKQFIKNHVESLPLKKKCEISDILNSIDHIIDMKSMTGQILFLDGGEFL